MNAPDANPPPERGAFFTLSLLFDRAQVNDLLRACWGRAAAPVWDERLLQKLQLRHSDSGALHAAINPMFDDIADRARNLFLRDFLLDTLNDPSAQSVPADSRSNVCERLALALSKDITWRTEGRPTQSIDLGPISFTDVLCRAFWMAHSNEALSYHLSLEVPYEDNIVQHFGLSMLQKAFFTSEQTDWLLDDPVRGWQAKLANGTALPLLSFVEQLFERHVRDLLAAIGRIAHRSTTLPVNVDASAWQILVLCQPGFVRSGTNARAWANVARHRRLLVVLRDAAFFETLERARRQDDPMLGYQSYAPSRNGDGVDAYDPVALRQQIRAQVTRQNKVNVGDDAALEAAIARYTHALFLSGFLQNIVDFLQQDGLEVHDGLMPIYPPRGEAGANEGFLLYATPSVLIEVVSTSRSLDGAGRHWIGTCPYIFLVHMTAFHNESLVLAYEDNVSRLVGHLQARGLRSDADAASERFEPVLKHAFECIRDFRLVTFEQVHKHYSFNVFRYPTEQQFFASIEGVRGVAPRREYWDKVLQHLTETVDGLKADRHARVARNVAVLGVVLAVTGVVQTWLAVFPLKDKDPWRELSGGTHWLALVALLVLLIGLGLRFVLLRWRGTKAASWRTHGQARTTSAFSPSR
jgi:hypothetical protein